MDPDVLRTALRSRLERRLAGSGLSIEVVSLFAGVPPLETDATSAIVRAAERLTGHGAEAVAFATEGPYLTELGMETLILGPGDIAQAHQPDEYLSMDRLEPTVELLRRLIGEFCVRAAADIRE
jgi:acetylornithine deacetylase